MESFFKFWNHFESWIIGEKIKNQKGTEASFDQNSKSHVLCIIF